MLLQTWLAMAGWWRSAFFQDRSFLRVLWILLGLLAARGRGTVTSALAMFGLTGRWSADFRAFSRSDWDARTCFRGVLHHAAPYLRDQRQIVMSLDDTGLPKRSRMIKACSWLRDPLGPRFQTNFVWGLRCLHAIVQMKAFGPTRTDDYHELPPWRSHRDREGLRKPSANDLLTRLRADLAAQVHAKPPDGALHPRETFAAA
jgi:hypothetical protein